MGGLVKPLLGHPISGWSGEGPKNLLSPKFPGDTDAACVGTTRTTSAPQPGVPILDPVSSSMRTVIGGDSYGLVALQASCNVCLFPLRDVKVGVWVREVTA